VFESKDPPLAARDLEAIDEQRAVRRTIETTARIERQEALTGRQVAETFESHNDRREVPSTRAGGEAEQRESRENARDQSAST